MSGNEPTIEAEVVEIDGIAVEPRPVREEKHSDWKGWSSNWQGRVKRLDARWWPLWAVLGFIVLVIAVAVGMCVAVVFVAYRIFKALFNGFANLLFPSQELRGR
jgi:ABC-type spermidine/putrescine transport system permease subunit II